MERAMGMSGWFPARLPALKALGARAGEQAAVAAAG
jgi:hypothetical protein